MKSASSIRSLHQRFLFLLMAAAMFVVSGCGGGGSSNAAPVSITVQSVPVSAVAGTSATFSVVATGDGLAFQWQRSTDNATTWADIQGATAATYVVAVVDASMNGYEFRAIVSGTSGAVTSSAATLTVTPSLAAPAITAQPSDQLVSVGANASFSVSATGTALAYQWQSSPDSITWTNVSGAAGATLPLTAVALTDSGKHFRAAVSNSAGSVNSNPALLTVVAAGQLPVISAQPAAASVVAPQTATFTVGATGTPAPSYQWQQSTNGAAYADIVGATAASYTTPATTASDTGKLFKVRVTNTAGSVLSNSASLTVAASGVAPAFMTDAADFSVLAPDPGVFSARASGIPTPTYQWQLSTDAGLTFANINGATAATFTSAATTLANNATYYRVVATNSVGGATSRSAKLTVYNPGVGGQVASVARDGQGNLYATILADTFSIVSTFRTATFYGIRKIDTNGVVTTLAGNNTQAFVNGTGSAASFRVPFGIAVDSHGNVFVSDTAVAAIRKITSAGVVTTFAGGNINGGYVNGNGTQASFNNPLGLTIDASDNIYVADAGNHVIRKITPAGDVTTLAGSGRSTAYPTDGIGIAAGFNFPRGVSVDGAGNVYVADTLHNAIRKITPAGAVTTLAGSHFSGSGLLDGTGDQALFYEPEGVAVDASGVIWVADHRNEAIRKITPGGVVTTFAHDGGSNNIIVDANGNLYMDYSNFHFPQSPYEIRKLTPAGISTAIPDCCTQAP